MRLKGRGKEGEINCDKLHLFNCDKLHSFNCDKLHSFNCDKLPSCIVTNCPQTWFHYRLQPKKY
ncbi:hypothetical protein BN1200_1940015 [Klebsiella variicola]|nr:hypothetical protein BN1200_1940015 [Klebsiella variicola]